MRETTRERRVRERGPSGPRQAPWRRLEHTMTPSAVLSEDQVEAIHEASLRILKELGLEFQNPEALSILDAAGADVDHATGMVRFDPDLVEWWVGRAPSAFTLHSRNPARFVTIGGRHIAFNGVSGPPNCSDLDRGRRPGRFADQCELIRLVQSLDALQIAGGAPVEAMDLPVPTRHLDTLRAFVTLTDKVFYGRAIGGARIRDAVAVAAIARGETVEDLEARPAVLAVVNVNSPRRVDGEMASGLMTMARLGQPTIVTPFTLAGAMSPVTLAGALTQQNAEALGVIAFSQMVASGSPIVYGGFTSNVDLRTGAPAFGTPEYALGTIATGQLARRYRLPYRTSNVNASNAVDAQAAYESMMSLWAALVSGANLIHHAAGWLEGGLVASYEKMVLDAEMLQMMGQMMQPILVDEGTLAMSAQQEVPAGGHFFGTAHTLERYETAFYTPLLSDWRNYDTWREAGSQDATTRANRIWKQLL
jgi:trimethylamine--corrinoid protein Co-methyltransferase